MNYTNNIDKYYIHANYNHTKSKEMNRIKLLLLLALLGIGLIMYFIVNQAYQFTEGIESGKITGFTSTEVSKSETSTSIATEKVNEKVMVSTAAKNASLVKIDLPKVDLSKKAMQSSLVFPSVEKEETSTKVKVYESQTLANASVNDVLSAITTTKSTAILSTNVNNSATALILSTLKEKASASVANSNPLLVDEKTALIAKSTSTDSNISTAKIPMQMYHLYIVSRGETLYSIAMNQYNDKSMYQEIIAANPDLENPNSIHEGQEILLPIKNEQKAYSAILHFK